MSALAQVFQSLGNKVTGSDMNESGLIESLRSKDIKVDIGHKKEQSSNADWIIYSEAIPANNPELNPEIKQSNYFEALAELQEMLKGVKTIAIAGTHGKSSTVSMLASCLHQAGIPINVIVGTKMKDFNGQNFLTSNDPKYLLVEACEYRRNFLPIKPDLLGITNIEFDHPDYFKDEEDYFNAFTQLKTQSQTVTDDYETYQEALGTPGEHNKMNAGLAFKMAMQIDPSKEEKYREALKNFEGAWRRFDKVGTFNGADLILDYAHHPSEIKTTLKTAREVYPNKRILAVFQVHQHSRAIEFIEEFKESFHHADYLFIPDIYACRDSKEDVQRMSTEDFVKELQKKHSEVEYTGSLENTANMIKNTANSGDVIIIMGAGNVDQITKWLV